MQAVSNLEVAMNSIPGDATFDEELRATIVEVWTRLMKSAPPAAFTFSEKLRYTVPQASALLGQSRAKTYCDLRDGQLRAIKDGQRTYIPGSEIARRSRLADGI